MKNAGLLVRVVTAPGGKDPDEFSARIPSDGPERFKRLIQDSGNDTEYRLAVVREKYDLSTEDGKSATCRRPLSRCWRLSGQD